MFKAPFEKVQVYAFDEPFNRSIALVYGQVFIGEAHPVQGLNLIEERRYRVLQHMQEQAVQLKTYSSHIQRIHRIVNQNSLVELGTGIPAVDQVAYGQAVDTKRDASEAVDDTHLPEELKELAENYKEISIDPIVPDIISEFLVRLASSDVKEQEADHE